MREIYMLINIVVVLIAFIASHIIETKACNRNASTNAGASNEPDVLSRVRFIRKGKIKEPVIPKPKHPKPLEEIQPVVIPLPQTPILPNVIYKGRIIIPEYSINTRLYKVDPDTNENRIAIVDAENSACFTIVDNTYVVGDHYYQGFSALWDAYVGLNGVWEDESGNQHNLQAIRVDNNGVDGDNLYWSGIERAYPGPGHFVLYTRNHTGGPESVTIVDFTILN